jgi:hypothetical protein
MPARKLKFLIKKCSNSRLSKSEKRKETPANGHSNEKQNAKIGLSLQAPVKTILNKVKTFTLNSPQNKTML